MEKRTSCTSRMLWKEVMGYSRAYEYADGSTIGVPIKYPVQQSSRGGGKKGQKGKGR